MSIASTTARADDRPALQDIETKYIFGFTEGSSIGLEGEKEFAATTVASFGKREGRYAATQTKLEFEHTPTQFIQVEFGALVATHNIHSVPDLVDRNAGSFMGLFAEFRRLLIERSASSPLAVALSVEPVWRRIDETSGSPVRNVELEVKLNADVELLENRVYLGFNAIYEPEWTRTPAGESEKESTLGLSAAIALRPIAPLVIGLELGYFRHYDAITFTNFSGDAFFLGPTLYYRLTRKSFLTAAWATQIAGHAVDDPQPLNLTEFPRHRAKLKYAVEF